jgi:hypothetical protein
VNTVSTAKVSQRGKTSLPAGLRRRWGIEDGGEVAFVDLGDAALILPGGIAEARAELRRVLFDEGAYEAPWPPSTILTLPSSSGGAIALIHDWLLVARVVGVPVRLPSAGGVLPEVLDAEGVRWDALGR